MLFNIAMPRCFPGMRSHFCAPVLFKELLKGKAHGANLSDSCSIFLRRLFRAGDGVLVDSLLVILCTCKAMRRSSSHHGDDSYYSDSLALRRWSSSRATVTSCPISSAALTPIFPPAPAHRAKKLGIFSASFCLAAGDLTAHGGYYESGVAFTVQFYGFHAFKSIMWDTN